MNQPSEPRQLSASQKAGFISLLVFAILTISFSFLQLRNTVYGKFVIRAPQKASTLQLPEYDEMIRLQQIDTDRDGLTDYEEIYIYGTSPYLADTDGDGISDYDEIMAGTDPLCPEGTVCGESEFGVGVGSSFDPLSPLFDGASTPADILVGSQFSSNTHTTPDSESLLDMIENPDQLRQILRDTGQISEEDLLRIDDATLIALARELIEKQRLNAPAPNTTTTLSE